MISKDKNPTIIYLFYVTVKLNLNATSKSQAFFILHNFFSSEIKLNLHSHLQSSHFNFSSKSNITVKNSKIKINFCSMSS